MLVLPESRDGSRHGRVRPGDVLALWGREALAEFIMIDEMSDEFFRHALVKEAQACCVDKVYWQCVRLAVAGGGFLPLSGVERPCEMQHQSFCSF